MQQLINGLSLGAVYALIAVGFALVFSVLKFSNFSHGGVIMLSAYLGLWFSSRFPVGLLATVLFSFFAGGLIGVFIEKVAFRPIRMKNGPLIYFFISSIAVSLFLQYLVTALLGGRFYNYRKFFQSGSFKFGELTIAVINLYMLGVTALAQITLLYALYRTRIGMAIRAASGDLKTSNLMGINTDLVVSATFFTSGALAGIAGVFLGMSLSVYPQLGGLVLKAFVATVIGGFGSLGGAVVGALFLGLAETFITAYIGGGVTPMFTFSIMVFFLLVKPDGIGGLLGVGGAMKSQKA